jgi:class 3 adenylate cyclase/tetratricopeptide (TPR) repeat protein
MIACPSCGFEAPDDFVFCPKCGVALSAAAPVPEERKVVTTLFCDLVAFTAMSEAADPEDVGALLRRYHATARKLIESHGGTVEKFIGDAVVGVFGVPAVHEDDPERAVRAALRILEALEGISRPDGGRLEARVGVNTGEALVRLDVDPASGCGFLIGDAVNVAARLQTAAPPGGIAVGALTHGLTVRAIDYEELPSIPAKGKADPLPAWRALAALARRGIDAHTGDLTPLVGREAELSYLSAIFDKAMAQSTPQLALVVGEPGIGKSRLVRELSALVDARPQMITWRQGYCPPFGESITYWALAEIVKGHAGIRDTDDASTVRAKLETVLPAGPDREWFRHRLGALLGLAAPDASREENFAAWLRFFEDMAAARPTVLVFEDLHWADEALLAFLEHLTLHVASVPLMVIETTRPELFERYPSFARGGRLNRLQVEPLSAAETAHLVDGLLAGPDDCGEVIGRVVERCDGNPFYAEQSVRLLSDTEMDMQVPDSVHAVIAARLDALPPDQKALLADAAVVGSVFWDGVLTVMDSRDPEHVDDMLSALLERQLIRRIRESSMGDEREYAFVHALAREVAYRQLPRAARARRHDAVARWIERKAGGHPEDLADVLAHHFATALDLARAAGESDLAAQLLEPTLRFLTLAGDRAFNLDVLAAERFFAAALEVSAEDGPERAQLDLKLGEAALWTGSGLEAAESLRRAAEALRARGDKRSAAVATARLARARHNLAAASGDVEELYREAVALLDGDGPSDALVTVLTEWGRELVNGGQSDSALTVFEHVLEVARELGEPEPPLALALHGAVRASQGDRGFLEDYRRALEVAEAQGLGVERARIWGNYVFDLCLTEGPRRSLEEWAHALDFCTSRGLASIIGYQRANMVVTLVCAGDWDEALRESAEVEREFLEAAGNAADLLLMRILRYLPLVWRGEDADARVGLPAVVNETRCTSAVMDSCWGLTVLAIATARHDPDEAGRLLEEALAAASDDDAWFFMALPEAARVAIRCGDAGLADRLCRLVSGALPAVQHALATVAALRAEARGDREAAAAGFADAAHRWHEFQMPYEEGQALLGQGRCLAALERDPEAAVALQIATEIFASLGATPASIETERILKSLARDAGRDL